VGPNQVEGDARSANMGSKMTRMGGEVGSMAGNWTMKPYNQLISQYTLARRERAGQTACPNQVNRIPSSSLSSYSLQSGVTVFTGSMSGRLKGSARTNGLRRDSGPSQFWGHGLPNEERVALRW
jgi:hypothetical protein